MDVGALLPARRTRTWGRRMMANNSSFSLGLSSGAARAFMWLVAGHFLYVAGLAVVINANVERGNIWITPLFGIVWLLASAKGRFWARALLVIVAFTAIHYLAVEAAIQSYSGESTWVAGAVGGAVGSAASLILGILLGLLRRDSQALTLAAIGTLLLILVGSFGVHMYLSATPAGREGGLLDLLWIYTPWQVSFAYVLAKLLKSDASG
ncbi:hypothetical protein [Sphingosinicella sp.]|uniref:hypothetical protein n=1 Tax=Sphingosinicella sp. TaxID=1917971 RepID=UPI00403848EF